MVIRAPRADQRRRDAALRQASEALLERRDVEGIVDVVLATALSLAQDLVSARASLWIFEDHRFRRLGATWDAPEHATVELLEPHVVQRFLAGDAFVVTGPTLHRFLARVGSLDAARDVLVAAPVRERGTLTATLILDGGGVVDDDLRSRLGHLASMAGLALERTHTEDLLEEVIRSSADAIVITDEDLRIVRASPSLATMCGVAEDDAVDRDLPGLLVPVDGSDLRHALARPDPDAGLRARARGTRGEREIELRVTPLDTGRFQGRLAVLRDVTERLRMEERLRTTLERSLAEQQAVTEELRRVDELRSTFLSAVSHELRTPLTSVLGSAETLGSNLARLDDGQVTDLIASIQRNARRLRRLLADLLDIDRLDRGRLRPERVRTDLGALVRRVITEAELGDEPIVVEGADVHAFVDPAQIDRIVENLVRNACKHTPPGTPVTVRLEEAPPGGALLVVEDEGDGVAPESRHRIFQAFEQGPAARSNASPGTGIGLALVVRLAELHGGRTWVEDRPGGGARFCVWLPGVPSDRDGAVVAPRTGTRRPR